MKKRINIKITKETGLKYSLISGDKNKIHINENFGYNSIYGEVICHGTNVIIEFLKKINFEKNFKTNNFNININFLKHTSYNQLIEVKSLITSKKKKYNFFQNNKKIITLNVELSNNYSYYSQKFIKSEKIKFKNITSAFKQDKFKILNNLLNELSKYVGNTFPGKNSAINRININYNSDKSYDDKFINIKSLKINRRFPLVVNQLNFKNYIIEFDTIFLPHLETKFKKPTSSFINKIKKIKTNVLIIGASSGLGFDLLNLYKYNKKIKIFCTYYKNKINLKNSNINKIKYDVNNGINKLIKIIKKNNIISIYYFASPKIYSQTNNKYLENTYKKIFLDVPLNLLKNISNQKVNFFYPSTKFIDDGNKNLYAKIKLIAEHKLSKYNNNFCTISIVRIDKINTKQNINISGTVFPNFRDYLFKDKKLLKNTFFNLF